MASRIDRWSDCIRYYWVRAWLLTGSFSCRTGRVCRTLALDGCNYSADVPAIWRQCLREVLVDRIRVSDPGSVLWLGTAVAVRRKIGFVTVARRLMETICIASQAYRSWNTNVSELSSQNSKHKAKDTHLPNIIDSFREVFRQGRLKHFFLFLLQPS